jgi:cyclohexyl-isocyanide hydratase
MIAGDSVAQSIQLALEYDPAPPFAGGTPATAPDNITRNLRLAVYDKAATEMEAAIRKII